MHDLYTILKATNRTIHFTVLISATVCQEIWGFRFKLRKPDKKSGYEFMLVAAFFLAKIIVRHPAWGLPDHCPGSLGLVPAGLREL
jgi:hypothetical protein